MLLTLAEYQLPRWFGSQVPLPDFTTILMMLRSTQNFGAIFSSVIVSLCIGLLLLLFLVMMRMITKNRWVAAIISVFVFAAATARYGVQGSHFGAEQMTSWIVQMVIAVLILALLSRHGLVGVIFCLIVRSLLIDFPVTWEATWYAPTSLASVFAVVVMLSIGCYAAVGGWGFLLGTAAERPAEADH
jgi:hypothetical protein